MGNSFFQISSSAQEELSSMTWFAIVFPGFWQVEEVNSQHARWRARNSPTLLCATVLQKRCRENCLEANTCSRATQSLRARNKSEKIDRPIEAPDHISLTWLHSLPLGYPKGQSPLLDGQKILGQQVSQKKMIKFAWPIKMTERNGGYGGFLYLPITPQRWRFKRPLSIRPQRRRFVHGVHPFGNA